MIFQPQGLERIGVWKRKAAAGRHRRPNARAQREVLRSAEVVTDMTLNADPEGRTRQWVKGIRPFV